MSRPSSPLSNLHMDQVQSAQLCQGMYRTSVCNAFGVAEGMSAPQDRMDKLGKKMKEKQDQMWRAEHRTGTRRETCRSTQVLQSVHQFRHEVHLLLLHHLVSMASLRSRHQHQATHLSCSLQASDRAVICLRSGSRMAVSGTTWGTPSSKQLGYLYRMSRSFWITCTFIVAL